LAVLGLLDTFRSSRKHTRLEEIWSPRNRCWPSTFCRNLILT